VAGYKVFQCKLCQGFTRSVRRPNFTRFTVSNRPYRGTHRSGHRPSSVSLLPAKIRCSCVRPLLSAQGEERERKTAECRANEKMQIAKCHLYWVGLGRKVSNPVGPAQVTIKL